MEKLQQESWQLELLISGFALFGVYESKTVIDDFAVYVDLYVDKGLVSAAVGLLITILRAGWALFFINLLVHIIFRGLWIGAIGLRYVSREIEYDKLGYSEWMTNYLKRKVGDYDDYIERLEKLCSVLFAYTFLLFFLVVSILAIMAFFLVVGYVAGISDDPSPGKQLAVGVAIMVYLTFGLLVFIDFITLGKIRSIKDKSFSKWYGYVYRFYSYVTLSFLYRPLLYNFLDNRYTRRLFLFGIPYVLCILLVVPNLESNGHSIIPRDGDFGAAMWTASSEELVNNRFYDDLRDQALVNKVLSKRPIIKSFSIDEYMQKGTTLQLFVRINRRLEGQLMDQAKLSEIYKTGLRLSAMSAIHEDAGRLLEIDEQETETVKAVVSRRATIRSQLKDRGLYDDTAKDSLYALSQVELDSVESVYMQLRVDYRKQELQRIKTVLLDRLSITMDGQPVAVDASQLLFTQHPNQGEQGAYVYLPIDTLSAGIHKLSAGLYTGDADRRTAYSMSRYNTTIPFVVSR